MQFIHAWLECGIVKSRVWEHRVDDDLQVISIWPDIRDPHSPQEKVNISTVEDTEKVLFNLLKNV